MGRKRRSKIATNYNWSKIEKTEDNKRCWRYNPNCKYHNIVKAIEKEKRLKGEED